MTDNERITALEKELASVKRDRSTGPSISAEDEAAWLQRKRQLEDEMFSARADTPWVKDFVAGENAMGGMGGTLADARRPQIMGRMEELTPRERAQLEAEAQREAAREARQGPVGGAQAPKYTFVG